MLIRHTIDGVVIEQRSGQSLCSFETFLLRAKRLAWCTSIYLMSSILGPDSIVILLGCICWQSLDTEFGIQSVALLGCGVFVQLLVKFGLVVCRLKCIVCACNDHTYSVYIWTSYTNHKCGFSIFQKGTQQLFNDGIHQLPWEIFHLCTWSLQWTAYC